MTLNIIVTDQIKKTQEEIVDHNTDATAHPSILSAIDLKANQSNIYTKTETDTLFAAKEPLKSSDDNYVTDAQLAIIQNTSGINTGDETTSTIKTKIGAASTSNDGYLTSADWNTFNEKQDALSYTAANDSSVVHLASTETLTGSKTFSSDITNNANNILTNTTYASQKGIIYKGTDRFIHNFNYGNNGTVTTFGANTFIGVGSGNFTMGSTATTAAEGSCNTGIGYGVMPALTTGNNNVAVGFAALYGMNTGSVNTALGGYAGRFITGGSTLNQTSSNSVYLGYNTKAYADGDTNEIVIGYSTIGAGSNKAVIGNANITDIYANQNGTATVNAGKFKLSALNTAPSNASDTGTTGEIRITSGYIYVCVATNTWVRAALATW